MGKRAAILGGLGLAAVGVALAAWRLAFPAAIGPGAQRTSGRASDQEALAAPAEPAEDVRARTPIVAAEGDAAPGLGSSEPTELLLRGLVLEASGVPCAGAAVEVSFAPEASFETLDLEFSPPRELHARLESDGEGRFSVALDPDRACELAVVATGAPRVVVGPCWAGEDIEVRLPRAASVSGFVTRASDGTPVPDVLVRAYHGPGGDQTLDDRTDAGGHYELAPLSAGDVGLQVVPPNLASPRWIDLELDAETSVRRDVELEAGWALTGRVTDAHSGLPIADAEVSAWEFLHKTVRTGPQGFYRVAGVRARPGTLVARASGYGRSERSFAAPDEAGSGAAIDFELLPAARVYGRIVDESGGALAGALVSVCGHELKEGLQRREWRTVQTGGAGRFELTNVRTDLPLALFVRKPGYATTTRALVGGALDKTEHDVGDVVLPSGSVLAGTVLDAAERPAAGFLLELMGPSAEVGPALSGYTKRRQVYTGASGSFVFADLAAGTYRARLVTGERRVHEREFQLAQGERRRGLRWLLPAGGSLTGVVRAPDGAVPEAVRVALFAAQPAGPAPTVACDSDGAFAFEELDAEGEYTLRASAEDAQAWSPTVLRGLRADGRFVEVTLRRNTARLRGQVVDREGAAVPAALVARDLGDGLRTGAVLCGPDGSFELAVPVDGAWSLRAWRTGELDRADGGFTALEWRLQRRILRPEQPAGRLDDVPSGAEGIELVLSE